MVLSESSTSRRAFSASSRLVKARPQTMNLTSLAFLQQASKSFWLITIALPAPWQQPSDLAIAPLLQPPSDFEATAVVFPSACGQVLPSPLAETSAVLASACAQLLPSLLAIAVSPWQLLPSALAIAPWPEQQPLSEQYITLPSATQAIVVNRE